MTQELRPKIVVFGVGGAGGNAVNNMIEANLQGVEFVVANTDAQALARSRAEMQLQLGLETTGGLGAGARPEIGARAAEESLEEIRLHLEGAHMVFIAAGMGGGTGTGAAPVIARAAQEMGILTIAVVTKPFGFEGSHRMKLAEEGLARIRSHVDTMIVVPNQNLFRIANDRTTFADAFRMADDVLYNGVRGITDLIVMPGLINLDFADVGAIMTGMGTALMGMGEATGETRALDAARAAIDNPLLDDVTIRGAKGVLINITGGYDMTLFELDEAANEIRREADPEANIIIGSAFDTELEGRIRVSVVAAGLDEAARRLPAAQPATGSVRQPVAAPVEEVPAAIEADAGVEEMLETLVEETVAEDDSAVPVAANAEDEDRPVVITRPQPAAARPVMADAEAVADDEPEADAPMPGVFSGRKEAPAPDRPARETPSAGFANLFGWRRPTPQGQNDTSDVPAVPSQIVTSPEDHPKPAPFDDADLEIPAFLRRSANN
ncbi:cell division protein FtsZ [Hyphomonas neptunium ATCC 15444]|uniref:Cell division protein FtsZ n=2 Tax=Hyphomonas TaxID=85 RepID=Q0C573_HYPNA|nr:MULTISPECIES: cell division protein FtsZ [Hyphomonas]ABI75414.1 cell division protein FtsZ [Hyphomonas neptunium ATCC 15444]KCZ95553.1 cell division protein FtsZ [Hyphomonas hirschiana VP5]